MGGGKGVRRSWSEGIRQSESWNPSLALLRYNRCKIQSRLILLFV
jgi:hypothetical protein